MPTLFSETLVKFRKDAGFKTAYRFYHDNGGRLFFKFSYRMCLLIEQGKRMPTFKSLGLYVYALRLGMLNASAAELTMAWLRTAHGAEEVQQLLVPYLKLPQAQSVSSPYHKAIKKEMLKRTFHMSPRQTAVIHDSAANYLCWTALSSDTGEWTPEKLAPLLKLPVAAVKTAMQALAAARLLKVKKGVYKCPMSREHIETPHVVVNSLKEKIWLRMDEMINSGRPIFRRHGVMRASSSELRNLFPLLTLNVATMDTYAVTEKQKDSALFSIETKVVKIRDF
ncbi:MAG TPA: hypothetical protein DDW67_08310 [Elusimicrobia bacterium]|nr:hypothetical protein [Desulfobacterales bacterium]HBE89125.1 hypothetical protein [Elusimicrobiota bacterium]